MLKIKRRAAKQPAMVIFCIFVLCIYLYVFINHLHYDNPRTLKIYLPAIAGGIAGLVASFFYSIKKEIAAGIMFFSAIILTGAYQGLSETRRLIVALVSLILHTGATIEWTRLYIKKLQKKRKTRK